MEAILEKLIESPRLSLYQREIEQVLAAEQARRQQFLDELRDDEKAEFINGEVVVHSPVKLQHTVASKLLMRLLDTYVDNRNLGFVGYEKMLISLTRNDYEPDICFFRWEVADTFTPKQTRFPTPDFVAEVLSDSTSARDRGVKFDDYAAHGVQEYWIIDPDEEIVEQYFLEGDHYRLAFKVASGSLRSRVVDGFEIPVRAIFDADANLTALRHLLSE